MEKDRGVLSADFIVDLRMNHSCAESEWCLLCKKVTALKCMWVCSLTYISVMPTGRELCNVVTELHLGVECNVYLCAANRRRNRRDWGREVWTLWR